MDDVDDHLFFHSADKSMSIHPCAHMDGKRMVYIPLFGMDHSDSFTANNMNSMTNLIEHSKVIGFNEMKGKKPSTHLCRVPCTRGS